MTAIYHVLQQLSWPEKAKDNRGSLVFTATTGDLEEQRATSASVIVGHDSIKARIRSTLSQGNGDLEPRLEIQWKLQGQEALLSSFVADGSEQSLEEFRAFKVWQNEVNRLGVQPKFQEFAVRKTPEPYSQTPQL